MGFATLLMLAKIKSDQEIVQRSCAHIFPLALYVPPGRTVNVTCPNCGAQIPIRGNGPTC